MSSTQIRRKDWRKRRVLLAAVGAALLMVPSSRTSGQGGPTAPTYVVVSSGLSDEEASALGQALRVPTYERIAGGAFHSIDTNRFLSVPTMPVPPIPGSEENEDLSPVTSDGIDFDALQAQSPPSRAEALRMVQEALGAAGIFLVGGTPHVAETYFDAFGSDERLWLHHAIARNVAFAFQPPDGR